MADDKNKTGKRNRNRLSAGDDDEVRDFAEKFDMSVGLVRDLIRQHGNDRKTLERAARKLKGA
jgi:Protein of unknown function (DUF3606)